jgi:hypothetical protein
MPRGTWPRHRAPRRDAGPQRHQNTNNRLELYSAETGLSELKRLYKPMDIRVLHVLWTIVSQYSLTGVASTDGFHVIDLLPSFAVTFVFSRYSRVSLVIDRNVRSTKHQASSVSLVIVAEAIEGSAIADTAKFWRVFAPCLAGGAPYHPGPLVSPVVALLGYEQHDPGVGQGTWL